MNLFSPPGPTTMYNMIPYSLHPSRFTRPHGKINSSIIAQATTPHTAPAVTTALSKMLTKTRQPEAWCHLPSSTVACTYNNSNDTIVELFNCLLLAVACRGFVQNSSNFMPSADLARCMAWSRLTGRRHHATHLSTWIR